MAVIANLIVKVAADVSELKTNMEKAEGAITSTVSTMKAAAGAIGVAFSVGAVVQFAGRVMDAASEVHDMALQLGLSAEAVQGFKFAAEQAGSSLDAVGTAVTKMNQHLAVGDASTVKALQAAGLSFADIRAMKPEDAFLAIADAIQKIPDPMVRSQVALALFGKGAAELLPAIMEGFRAASDGVAKFSTDTVNSLEAAQDAWKKLGNSVTVVTGGLIAEGFKFLNVWSRMKDDLELYGIVASKVATVPPPTLFSPGGIADIKLSDEQIKEYTRDLDDQRKVLDRVAEAQQALTDKLFGRDLIARAAEFSAALGGIDNIAKLTKESQAELNRVMGAAYDVLVRAGQGASAAAMEYHKLRDASTDFAAINQRLLDMPDPYAAKQHERMVKIADTEKALLNQNVGLSASEQYWMHAGEIADQSMAQAREAVETVAPAAAAAAGSMHQSFSFALQGIANDAATTSARIAQLMSDSQKNILRGGIAATYGFYQQQQITALQNPMPGYATGGPVTQDGPIYAHAGEYVVPKGGGGGASLSATVVINVSGSDPQRAGRDAMDAFAARAKEKGIRI